jgi:hypothetical protein
MEVNEKQHGLSIFRALLPYYGKIVTPNFLKKTAEYIPGIVRIHQRDRAFKEVVMEQYAFTCAVTGTQYYSDHLVEVDANKEILFLKNLNKIANVKIRDLTPIVRLVPHGRDILTITFTQR